MAKLGYYKTFPDILWLVKVHYLKYLDRQYRLSQNSLFDDSFKKVGHRF